MPPTPQTPHRAPLPPTPKKPRPRGARPTPKHRKDSAPKYQPKKAPPAWFAEIPKTLLDWLNLDYGDCVTAEECWAKAVASVMAGQSELLISDQTCQTWATKNNVLDGADLGQVLDLMAQEGFSQGGQVYGDGPAALVDYTNPTHLQTAICEGPVKLGVVGDPLDAIVDDSNGWLLQGVPRQDPNNEDHCIGVSGYGSITQLLNKCGKAVPPGVNGSAPGWLCFTWGTMGVIDAPSFQNMTFEAWLRTPTTVLQGGPTPPTPPTPPAPGGLTITVPTAIPAATYQLLGVPAPGTSERLGPIATQTVDAIIALLQQLLAAKK